jgi:hypothetical protein
MTATLSQYAKDFLHQPLIPQHPGLPQAEVLRLHLAQGVPVPPLDVDEAAEEVARTGQVPDDGPTLVVGWLWVRQPSCGYK